LYFNYIAQGYPSLVLVPAPTSVEWVSLGWVRGVKIMSTKKCAVCGRGVGKARAADDATNKWIAGGELDVAMVDGNEADGVVCM
jgi:hypothetical protein